MITHQEAEILISARQDEPLDPMVERELQAHLATCDACRAFAISTEKLTAGIKSMPGIPMSPQVRREVMEQVHRGRNPLAGLFSGAAGSLQTGPVLAAASLLVVVALVGWLALDRFVFDGSGGNDNDQLAAVPTEQVEQELISSPTSVPPTEPATEEPTDEPASTDEPVPTATNEPEPTATNELAPTDEPEPTVTNEPEPTATNEPEPTATSEPDGTDEGPTDLTTLSSDADKTPEPTATSEPTSEPEPTATSEPTSEPEPTATSEPTSEPEPTATVAPTQTPAIEPIEALGTGAQSTGSDETDGQGGMDGDDSTAIEPTDPEALQDATSEADADEPDPGMTIEQIGPDSDSTPAAENEDEDTQDSEDPTGTSLEEASVSYQNIAGDPSGMLGLTSDGRLEFMIAPDLASTTTFEGYQLSAPDAQPDVIQLCGDGFCEPALEIPEAADWQGDYPLAVVDGSAYFLRTYSDRTEVYAASPSGTQLVEPQLLTEMSPASPPSSVYENSGIMFAWLDSGEWLEISGGSAQIYSGGYSNPSNLRFAPAANSGPLIGYLSDGSLIIAPVTGPDAPILALPVNAVDFDLTGSGDRVAVIENNNIVIYDMKGQVLSVYEGGDRQPGSLIWLNSGIVYVDRTTGALYQIPETAP